MSTPDHYTYMSLLDIPFQNHRYKCRVGPHFVGIIAFFLLRGAVGNFVVNDATVDRHFMRHVLQYLLVPLYRSALSTALWQSCCHT